MSTQNPHDQSPKSEETGAEIQNLPAPETEGAEDVKGGYVYYEDSGFIPGRSSYVIRPRPRR